MVQEDSSSVFGDGRRRSKEEIGIIKKRSLGLEIRTHRSELEAIFLFRRSSENVSEGLPWDL